MNHSTNSLYESAYVGQFTYLWGRRDASAQNPKGNANILVNAQNFFDNTLGDVAARVHNKFFLIEFKRRENLFMKEVSSTGKPDRHLHFHRLKDSDLTCRLLSFGGHWAAYGDDCNQMKFKAYFKAADRNNSAAPGAKYPQQYSSELSFDDFYEAVHEPSKLDTDENFFKRGVGLPAKSFAKYIRCLYKHQKKAMEDVKAAIIKNNLLDDDRAAKLALASKAFGNTRKNAATQIPKPNYVTAIGLDHSTGKISLVSATAEQIHSALNLHLQMLDKSFSNSSVGIKPKH